MKKPNLIDKLRTIESIIKVTQTAIKTAGWDYAKTDQDIMELLEGDMPDVDWIMKDNKAVYGVDSKNKDYVVALYNLKRKGWVGYKEMSGKMGPYQKPPAKFWNNPKVKKVLG